MTTTAGGGTIDVPVTGVAAGSVVITASVPGYANTTTTVTVNSNAGISATWYGACWASLTINGVTGNFQAIDFALSAPAPAVLNGTLYFAPNCDPSQGVDNMNDTGATTGSGHMIQGFARHPGQMPTSAMYWFGTATSINGGCPAGSVCSGCVNYTPATPNCSNLP
jgi:hypothetical protein